MAADKVRPLPRAPRRAAVGFEGYYKTPEWRALRLVALEAAQNRCQACGQYRTSGLHVHHRYGIRADPEGMHLVVLCPPCHHNVEDLAARKGRLTPELAARLESFARDKIRGGPAVEAQD